MENETVTYEVQLDHPDFYVEFQAKAGLTEDEILTFAIEAMTWKTEVCSVKIKNNNSVKIIDHCEYIQHYNGHGWDLVHKGNCTNIVHYKK